MAYVFLDDGGPDAQEYESNYFYFNGSDSRTLSQIQAALRDKNQSDPNIRSEIDKICHASLENKQKSKINKSTRTNYKELILQRFRSLI